MNHENKTSIKESYIDCQRKLRGKIEEENKQQTKHELETLIREGGTTN